MCDCDAPTIYDRRERRAKREHRCCECRKPIPAGARYWEHRGLWDGRWGTYRRCLRCERVCNRIEHDLPVDCCMAFGDMRAELRERSSWRRTRYFAENPQ